MKGDAAFLLAPETAQGRDPAAVTYRRDHQFIQEGAVDEPVDPVRSCLADLLAELFTSPDHDVGSQASDELLVGQ